MNSPDHRATVGYWELTGLALPIPWKVWTTNVGNQSQVTLGKQVIRHMQLLFEVTHWINIRGRCALIETAAQFQIISLPLLLSNFVIYFHSCPYTFIDINSKVLKFVEPIGTVLICGSNWKPGDHERWTTGYEGNGLNCLCNTLMKESYNVLSRFFIWQEKVSGTREWGISCLPESHQYSHHYFILTLFQQML